MENCLYYKGYPLVRKGKEIYYGFMSDPYVIYIMIMDTDNDNMTSKVKITLMDTNKPNPLDAFVKTSTKECGLYEALDIADVWLKKALAKQ